MKDLYAIYEERFRLLARAVLEWPALSAQILLREGFLLGDRERRIWEAIRAGGALDPQDLEWVMGAMPFPFPPDPESLVRSLADAAKLVWVSRLLKEGEEALRHGESIDWTVRLADIVAKMETSRGITALDGLEHLATVQRPYYHFLGDPHLPIPPGRMVVVAGPPNSGKTITATGEAIRCARAGLRVLLAMAEESLEITVSRLLAGVARVPLRAIQNAWGDREALAPLLNRIAPEDLEALARIVIISPKTTEELISMARLGFHLVIADAVYRLTEGSEVHAEIKTFLQHFAQILIDVGAVALLTVQTSTPFTRMIFQAAVRGIDSMEHVMYDTTGTAYSAAFAHEAEVEAYVVMPLAWRWNPDLAQQFGISSEEERWRALMFYLAKNKPQGFPRKIPAVVDRGEIRTLQLIQLG